ncbi:PIKK family atypical protein kinase [Histomonas meleagridis]|uniref:PIKK family atypical protein kinase n=1 Tax=Histomonas meleagridis TaxID=135588 RepID=UPI00355971AB|nr:PIKK family atypical protein kinase [Histomonas meleagridis]KAH0798961.1 PIKK family atypical protein kinase [Histomonas meleagridis]
MGKKRQSQSGEKQISKKSKLEKHIDNVRKYSNDMHSISFRVAANSFKDYVQTTYKHKTTVNMEGNFFKEIFTNISMKSLDNNIFHHLLFLTLIIDLDLGSNIKKAQSIAKETLEIIPTGDKRVFKFLESILVWLEGSLKISLHYILQPLRENIWKWANAQSEEKTLSSLMLTDIFLRKFPSFLSSDYESLRSLLLRHLDSNYPSIQKMTVKLYHSVFRLLNHFAYSTHIRGIIDALSTRLNDRKASFSVSTIDSISKIVTQTPEFGPYLNFKEVPFAALNSTENLRLIPLAYRCSPDLFTSSRINGLYELFNVMVKQNNDMADSVLCTIGED